MRKQSAYLFIIPLFIAVGFAGLMIWLAIISTENAREHYRAKKFNEAVRNLAKNPLGQNNPAFEIFNTKKTPTPTPTPEKTKSFLETAEYYEASYLIIAFFLLITGLRFLKFLFSKLPARNPLQLSDLTIRCVFLMLCSLVFSPAFFILYIWLLRNGFL
jgi:hypothetical protein